MSSENTFSIINNGIDSNLEIIQHNETGFYNITKTAKMIADIAKKTEFSSTNEAAGYPAASYKLEKPAEFFRLHATTELVKECKDQTNLDKVHYELRKGIPTRYAGTYVHKLIYDHFMAWLDPKYAIRISIILDKYHQDANQKIIAEKDDKIDKLGQKLDKQSEQIREQSDQIKELLGLAKEQRVEISEARQDIQNGNAEISKLHTKIDTMFEFLLSFARITIPTWIGSSVIKQQFDTLSKNKDTGYALKHLKVLFMVGFYDSFDKSIQQTKLIGEEEFTFTGRGQMKIYACCTNFADIGKRIRMLYQRHTNYSTDSEESDKHIMCMLKPQAISLISCEVNLERIILENSNAFPEKSIVVWESLTKSYNITIDTKHYKKAQTIFDTICDKASNERFQGYQMRMDEYNSSDSIKIDSKITNYIDQADLEFFSDTKPFCQMYIDSYTTQSLDKNNDLIEYEYKTPSRACKKRSDLDNRNLSVIGYSLRKIQIAVEDHNAKDHIKHMTETGIISKEDVSALKALAKFENIDLSDIDIPDEFED